MKKIILNIAILIGTLFLINSCVKDTYDGPDTGCIIETPEKGTSITIQQLLNNYSGLIEEDIYIEGTVISDDEFGNFYKSLTIQDSTAGIKINLNATSLSATYPAGRNVYVLLQGLYVNNFGEIASNSDNDRIPVSLLTKYIKKGECFVDVKPDTVAIADLNASYINKLVTVVGVEFTNAMSGPTYADPINQTTANLDLTDCSETIIVRTSGYAQFAGDTVPKGNGYITGVFNIFGSDKQLFIRSTKDVVMEGTRCDGSGGGGGGSLGYFSDDFASQNFTTKNWNIQTPTGTNPWETSDQGSGGNFYAVASNWDGSANIETESWLISPTIDLSGATSPVLSFRNAYNYTGASLEVKYSTDYSGGNPSSATWTDLSVNLSTGSWDWVDSGQEPLPTNANVRIAFIYNGSNSDGSKWEIDDIIVEEL